MVDYLPPPEFDRAHFITQAWSRGARGQGVTVAVLDEALDPDSPYLYGSVDEVLDLVGGVPVRADSHGTDVARLVRMFAPDCRIVGMNVFPAPGSLPTSDYNKAVRRAATRGVELCMERWPSVRLINMSFDVPRGRTLGFGGCRASRRCTLCSAVNQARARGILPVAAAGNRGPGPDTMECPAVAEGAETVAALLSRRDAESFENAKGGERKRFGTSWSAAYFTGSMAALMSACPEASLDEVLTAYRASCTPLPGTTVPGRHNLVIALAHLIGVDEPSVEICWTRVAVATPNDWAGTRSKEGWKLKDAVDLLLLHVDKGLLRVGDSAMAREFVSELDRLVPWEVAPPELSSRADALRNRLASE